MEKYLDYYLKDERFTDLYNNGNVRVRKYLRSVFEKSYSLFVLHEEKRRRGFYADLNQAKTALTQDDYTYLLKYSKSFKSQEAQIDALRTGIGDGDAENDMDMFLTAGIGVAMDNAFETVKRIADDICGDNEHDGIAHYLHQYMTHNEKD